MPYRSSESGDSAPSTSKKQNFAVALRTGTTYSLYALGVKDSVTNAEILYKDLTQTSTNDLSDDGWAAPSANQSANTFTWFELFVYYRKTGLIYGGRGSSATAGTNFWAFSPTGTAFDENSLTVTFTHLGQGLVHSKDDILYVPYYNNGGAAGAKSRIAKNDNGSWTAAALSLPDAFIPTSICEFGNYLAISCRPASEIGKSVVYLWDRDATLTTLAEAIDFGEGNLQILEEVEGHLIGISKQGVGSSGQTNRFSGQITIRQYSGGTAQVLKTFISGSGNVVANDAVLSIFKQKVDHFLYFLMEIGIGGSNAAHNQQGIWKIGRVSPDAPFALTFDRAANNDVSGTYVMKAFQIVGDYVFLSYTSGGTFALDKTNNNETYANDNFSYYDTQIFNLGDSSLTKKLLGTTVFTEALGGTQSIVVAYRKDEDITSGTGAWTTISTHTTANSISRSAINIESSGANLPEFKEIQFRITSELGAKAITGFKFKAELVDKDMY